jgi:uncharacterized coiled-coil protein SlyX
VKMALKDYDTPDIWKELERRDAPLSAKILTLEELLAESQEKVKKLEAELSIINKLLAAIRSLTDSCL